MSTDPTFGRALRVLMCNQYETPLKRSLKKKDKRHELLTVDRLPTKLETGTTCILEKAASKVAISPIRL